MSSYEIADALSVWLAAHQRLSDAAKREVDSPGPANFELVADLREKEAAAWAEYEQAWRADNRR